MPFSEQERRELEQPVLSQQNGGDFTEAEMAEVQSFDAAVPQTQADQPTRFMEPFFEVEGDLSASGFEITDFARAAGNYLPSMIDNTAGVVSALASPLESINALARLASGIQKIHAGSEEDEDTQVARQAWEQMKQRYGDRLRETVVEDPAGVMLDLVSVLSPGLGAVGKVAGISKTGRLGRTATAARKFADLPATLPVSAVKAVAKTPKKIARDVLPSVFSLQTGKDPLAFEQMFHAGLRGTRANEITKKALRNQYSPDYMIGEMKGARSKIEKMREDGYKSLLEKVDFEAEFDLAGLQSDVLSQLRREWNVGVFPDKKTGKLLRHPNGRVILNFEHKGARSTSINKANQKVFEELVTEVVDWSDDSVKGLDALQQRLSDMAAGLHHKFRRAKKFITQTRAQAQGKLNQVEGMRDAKAFYAVQSGILDDMDTLLSGSSKNPESTIRKIIGSLSSENASLDIRRDLLKLIDERAGTHLMDAAAGGALSEILPTGIHARNQAMQALGFLTGGIYLSPFFYLGLPMSSPRVVGEFMRALGVGARKTQRVTNWLKRLPGARSLPGMGRATLRGATIADAVQGLLEQGQSISTAPMVEVVPPGRQGSSQRVDAGIAKDVVPGARKATVASRILPGKTPEEDPSLLVALPLEASESARWADRAVIANANFIPSFQNTMFKVTEGVKILSGLSSQQAEMIGRELGQGLWDYSIDHKVLGGPLSPTGAAFAARASEAVDDILDPERLWNDPFAALWDAMDIATGGAKLGGGIAMAGFGGMGIIGRYGKMAGDVGDFAKVAENLPKAKKATKAMDLITEGRRMAKKGEAGAVEKMSRGYGMLGRYAYGKQYDRIARDRVSDRSIFYSRRAGEIVVPSGPAEKVAEQAARVGQKRKYGIYNWDGHDELFHMPLDHDLPLLYGVIEDGMAAAFDAFGDSPSTAQILKSLQYFFALNGQKNTPEWVTHMVNVMPPSLLDDTLVQARALAPEDAMTWYHDVAKLAEDLVGQPNMDEFRGVFAITSAQNPVETNLADTLWVMKAVREHIGNHGKYRPAAFRKELVALTKKGGGQNPIPIRVMRSVKSKPSEGQLPIMLDTDESRFLNLTYTEKGNQVDKLMDFYETGTFRGNTKTKAYNLTFQTRHANSTAFFPFTVNDTHIAKLFGLRTGTKGATGSQFQFPSGENAYEYRVAQYMIAKAAQKANMNADEAQAVLWWYAKHKVIPKKVPKNAPAYTVPWRKTGTDAIVAGDMWPYELGSPESARMFVQSAYDELFPVLDTTKPVLPGFSNRIQMQGSAYPVSEWWTRQLRQDYEDVTKDIGQMGGRMVTVASKQGQIGSKYQTTEEVMKQFHSDVWKKIQNKSGTKIKALEDLENTLNFRHEVVTHTIGTWEGVEPNFSIMIQSGNEDAVKFVTAVMGEAFQQQGAVWSVNRHLTARQAQVLGGRSSAGLALRKRDGAKFSEQEVKEILDIVNSTKDKDGVNFSGVPAQDELRFLNFSDIDDETYFEHIMDALQARGVDLGEGRVYSYIGELIDESERAGNYGKISQEIWRKYSGAGRSNLPRGISSQLHEKFQETLDEYIARGLIRTDAGAAAGPGGILPTGFRPPGHYNPLNDPLATAAGGG